MTAEEKIRKAKIYLITNQPWFGQLSTYITLKEAPEIKTAAISENGTLSYNSEWIDQLHDDKENRQLAGILCHEILHLAYLHLFRIQQRNPIIWNLAADLKVNSEIKTMSAFKLPKGLAMPDYADSWTFGKVTISDISEKTTEQIYSEMIKKVPKIDVKIGINQDGNVQVDTGKTPEPWKSLVKEMVKDLIRSGGKDGVDRKDLPRLEKEWKRKVTSASQQMKGDIPEGLKRELLELENPSVSWTQILTQRFRSIERKHSWKRPHKKWLPNYFPGLIRNKSVKAVIAVDTSGSMSKNQLTKAISEIFGMANAFKHFQFYVCFNDADVWDLIEVTNGNKHKIRKLKPRGGGGTDFRPVFKMIKDKFRNDIDSLIFFTDGYGDFPSERSPYQTFWVTDSTDVKWPFGQVIQLKNYEG